MDFIWTQSCHLPEPGPAGSEQPLARVQLASLTCSGEVVQIQEDDIQGWNASP